MPDALKTDLSLTRRAFGRETSDRLSVDLQAVRGDLRQVSGRENLAQAILNRLLTRQGELSSLGHPDYGSRLYQLVGLPNNRRTQALAELYIRDSLASDSRIQEIINILISPPSRQAEKRNRLEMNIVVLPVDNEGPLTVFMDMNLEG
jgi:hypothetical protein